MCAYCNRRDNCSVCCSGEFAAAAITVSSHLSSKINSGKSAEKHQSAESKSIHTNISDIFQWGCPGRLAKPRLFIPTHRQTAKQKQKFHFSNTSGGRPLSSSSSSSSSSSPSSSSSSPSSSFSYSLSLTLTSLPFQQSFDKSADKRESVLISLAIHLSLRLAPPLLFTIRSVDIHTHTALFY